MEEDESDDDFDCEQFLLAEQVRKYHYHGLYPLGIFVIWTLLRADLYNSSDCDSLGNPPIIYASKSGSIVLLRLLLQYKADINVLSKRRETALIVACRNKRMKAIKFLLERGAQPDSVDRTGFSALRWAVTHEHIDMVSLLLRYDTSVTKDCYTAGSALDIAKRGSSEQCTQILKELEKKLAKERETLLLGTQQDAISELDDYRKKREAENAAETNATTPLESAPQTAASTKRSRRLRSQQKILATATRRLSSESSVGTRVATPPVKNAAAKSLEGGDHSGWIKVGTGEWKTRKDLPNTEKPTPTAETTAVEAFAPDKETVCKLLTSDGKWQTFLHQQMPHRVSQDHLTVEDFD